MSDLGTGLLDTGGRRIACVWLPRFGLAVAAGGDRLRRVAATTARGPDSPTGLAGTALYRPGTRWQELLECAPDLEAVGIRPGSPLKEAQARAPHFTYLPGDEATLRAIATAFDPVLDALDAFSPAVEPAPTADLGAGRATAFLDAAGLGPLYGPEERLGAALAGAAARAGGGRAAVGIASSKFTAWVAATLAGADGGGGVVVVPSGGEAPFLDPLPLEALPLDLSARRALGRLGVRTLGAFARLPANAVAHRYGPAGLHAHRLAQGADGAPLRPRRPRPAAAVALAFEWEETELDRLTFALKTLADQLAARLAALDLERGDGRDGFGEAGDGASAEEDRDGGGDGGAFADERAGGDDGGEIDVADPWPDDGEVPAAWVQRPAPRAGPRLGLRAIRPGRPGSPPGSPGRPGSPGHPDPSGPPRSQYAAEALRVIWRLSEGETREALLRLAEPACTAAVFTEHLRWHAEGLDRVLAPAPPPAPAPPHPPGAGTPSGASGASLSREPVAPGDAAEPGALRYDPLERRRGVVGITLEAVGVQVPGGTQLKLLATPLQWERAWGTGGGGGAGTEGTEGTEGSGARLDPVTRARYARRAVARLQARWGEGAVVRPACVPARLPERRVRHLPPELGLQLAPPGPAGPTSRLPRPALAFPPDTQDAEDAEDVDAPLLAQAPLWLVDPPREVQVMTTKRRGERPRLSGWPRPRQSRRIVRWGGPWRVVDASVLTSVLTTGESLKRDYYQIELEDGGAYLVYWDRVSDDWFLQGVFD